MGHKRKDIFTPPHRLDLATRSSSTKLKCQFHVDRGRHVGVNDGLTVFLFNCIGVGRPFGSVDQLVGEAFRDRFDISESGFADLGAIGGDKGNLVKEGMSRSKIGKSADPDGKQRDGLVNSAQGGYINSLASDGALRADPR